MSSGSRDTATKLVRAPAWVRSYRRRWLVRDVVGGLAAGSVVVPQAMAYATIADQPIEVGLYTCMVPLVVYALVGGSRTLSATTTSTVALLTGSTLLAADVAASSSAPAEALATLTMLVGLILIVARLVRLGGLVDNISEATLTGVKAGVGLTVAAGQLPKFLGVGGDPDATAFLSEVAGVLRDLESSNLATIGLAMVTIAILLSMDRLLPWMPAPLVAVGVGIGAVAVWSIDDDGVRVVGTVPSGLPRPVLPDVSLTGELLGGAFAIAVMCFMETASVAAAVRRPDEPVIDNDRELVASGLASLCGGVFRSLPAAGGFSQTAMNVQVGSRTQLSGLVTASLAVACALFLGGVLADLPEATLGSLVIVAVIGLISPSAFVRYWRVDRLSFWVAVGTAAAGLVAGLVAAVLIGVVLTLLLLLHELDQIGTTELQPDATGTDLRPMGARTVAVPGLLMLRVDGPLYTANVRGVRREILQRVEVADLDVVVVDLTAVTRATVTVADQLGELRRGVAERGAVLWLAAVSPEVAAVARDVSDWDEMVAAGEVHPTAFAAWQAYGQTQPSER
jgi:SulP family sulfate permease